LHMGQRGTDRVNLANTGGLCVTTIGAEARELVARMWDRAVEVRVVTRKPIAGLDKRRLDV